MKSKYRLEKKYIVHTENHVEDCPIAKLLDDKTERTPVYRIGDYIVFGKGGDRRDAWMCHKLQRWLWDHYLWTENQGPRPDPITIVFDDERMILRLFVPIHKRLIAGVFKALVGNRKGRKRERSQQ